MFGLEPPLCRSVTTRRCHWSSCLWCRVVRPQSLACSARSKPHISRLFTTFTRVGAPRASRRARSRSSANIKHCGAHDAFAANKTAPYIWITLIVKPKLMHGAFQVMLYYTYAVNRCAGGNLFSGYPFVSAYVRPCVSESVRPSVLLSQYLTNQWTQFHRTLDDDVVEATDKRITF